MMRNKRESEFEKARTANARDTLSTTWNRVQELFVAALGLPPSERAALLDRECANQPAVRAEVESLLAYDCDGDVLSVPFELAAAAMFEHGEASLEGRRVGAYRIVRELGRGGMGAVYLAVRSDEAFEKQVAIKLIKRGMDTESMLERFRQERQILAGLDHPYIARLLDGGSTPEGTPYFVLEYVEGDPIDAYCHAHSLSAEQRCRLFLRVCEGVAYAHRNLVVHRDLKPGNILVTGGGTPKLLDFGVAKLLGPGSGVTVTLAAQRAFTPEYASPEQVLGSPVTTASDVYSLGAVLYELLTGSRPHRLPADAPGEWAHIVSTRVAARARTLNPALPADLDRILAMALRPEADRRYSSVEQLAADILRFLDRRPVAAREDSFAYRATRYVQRNGLAVAAGVAVALSLLTATVVSVRQARRTEAALAAAEAARQAADRERQRAEQEHAAAETQRGVAQTEARNARTEEHRANQRLNQMVELANRSLFEIHAAIESLPGATAVRQRLIATTLGHLENLAKDGGADERLTLALGAAYLRIGDVQGFPNNPSYGDTKGALQSYEKAQAVLAPLLRRPARNPEAVRTWTDLQYSHATVLIDVGALPAAAKMLESALPLATEPASRVKLRRALVNAIQHTDPDRALGHGRTAIAEQQRLLARSPASSEIQYGLASTYSMVGALLRRRDDFSGATAYLRESGRIRRELVDLQPNDPRYRRALMLTYGQIAAVLEDPGNTASRDIPEAREHYRKAWEIAREAVRLDPDSRVAQYDLASAEQRLGSGATAVPDRTEALALLEHSRRTFEALVAAEPDSRRYKGGLSAAYRYAAENLMAAGRNPEALSEFRRALRINEEILKAAPRDEIVLRQSIGFEQAIARLLLATSDRAGAVEFARRAVTRAAANTAGDRPATVHSVAVAHLVLAEILMQSGDAPEAGSEAGAAVGILRGLVATGEFNEAWRADLARAEALAGESGRKP